MAVRDLVETVIGDKARWRAYKKRCAALPSPYRSTIEAVERYLLHFGGGTADAAVFDDLVELFEQAASAGTPVRRIVGDDPVEFVELFARNYPQFAYLIRERKRLTDAVDAAEAQQSRG